MSHQPTNQLLTELKGKAEVLPLGLGYETIHMNQLSRLMGDGNFFVVNQYHDTLQNLELEKDVGLLHIYRQLGLSEQAILSSGHRCQGILTFLSDLLNDQVALINKSVVSKISVEQKYDLKVHPLPHDQMQLACFKKINEVSQEKPVIFYSDQGWQCTPLKINGTALIQQPRTDDEIEAIRVNATNNSKGVQN